MKRPVTITIALTLVATLSCLANPEIDALRDKAEQGDAESQFALARHLLLNDRADAEALVWYEKSANQNNVEAAQALSNLYRSGLKDRFDPDPEKALHWQTVAAETGDLSAMYGLGRLYHYGFGDVWPEFQTSRDEANQWYLKASDAGHASSTIELLKYFIEVRQYDYARAVSELLVKQKPAEGHFYTGLLLENGWGFETDQAAAVEYYKKAAEKDHDRAQRALDRIKRTSAKK